MEKISAFMDGEIEGHEAAAPDRAAQGGSGLRAAWDTYHLIGDAMRGEARVCRRTSAQRFSAGLPQEPTILAPAAASPQCEPCAGCAAGGRLGRGRGAGGLAGTVQQSLRSAEGKHCAVTAAGPRCSRSQAANGARQRLPPGASAILAQHHYAGRGFLRAHGVRTEYGSKALIMARQALLLPALFGLGLSGRGRAADPLQRIRGAGAAAENRRCSA